MFVAEAKKSFGFAMWVAKIVAEYVGDDDAYLLVWPEFNTPHLAAAVALGMEGKGLEVAEYYLQSFLIERGRVIVKRNPYVGRDTQIMRGKYDQEFNPEWHSWTRGGDIIWCPGWALDCVLHYGRIAADGTYHGPSIRVRGERINDNVGLFWAHVAAHQRLIVCEFGAVRREIEEALIDMF